MAEDRGTNNLQRQEITRLEYNKLWLTESTLPKYLSERLGQVGLPSFPNATLTQHAPKKESAQPGISWRIVNRSPGKDRQDVLKPSLKCYEFKVRGGEFVSLWTQYQTVLYEFVVYAQDYELVNDLVDQFEMFLFAIQPDIQGRMVENFLFDEEVREDLAAHAATRGRAEELPARVLRYRAWVQKRYEISSPVIMSLEIASCSGQRFTKNYPVIRGSKNYDLLDIPITRGSRFILSKKTYEDFQGDLADINNNGTYVHHFNYVTSNIYEQDRDYEVAVTSPNGVPILTIVWPSGLYVNKPAEGETYYIHYYIPEKLTEVKSSLPIQTE